MRWATATVINHIAPKRYIQRPCSANRFRRTVQKPITKEVTNIQFNKIFYEHYAVIPRGTISQFLEDHFILINLLILSFIGSSRLKNFIKNFHLIFNFIVFYRNISTLLNHSFYFSIKKLIILLP